MATSRDPQLTDFSRDVLGRYVCNGFDEALASTDTARRPDARPFDVIILGGGTFGGVLAEHLWFRDVTHRHRILVLDAGPLVLPEHIQNLPLVGARLPIWGVPWRSATAFPGLAYCVGGRSIFWGGWAPSMLPDEWSGWPAPVVSELDAHYLPDARGQLGVDQTNDFVYGPLHSALREQLLDSVGAMPSVVPLDRLPNHPGLADDATPVDMERMLGLPSPSSFPERELRDMLKLEAPLAIQGHPPRAGFFPLNKFSSVPLLIKASREAQLEAEAAGSSDGSTPGDDVKKRLMLVPRCRVLRLRYDGERVTAVVTDQGELPVPDGGVVVLALGTIESTRLALRSFGDGPGVGPIGRNLHAHLRSNLTVRFPRASLPGLPATLTDLEASALFVKGVQTHRGIDGYFHLQITASGGGGSSGDSEADLFKKIPDIDTIDRLRQSSPTHVVVAIRSVGEMERGNEVPSRVTLGTLVDEYGEPRADVVFASSARDAILWTAMDEAAMDVAFALAAGGPMEILSRDDAGKPGPKRDGLGSTHHEAGTLSMGIDPASSVTDTNGRLHGVANAYVVGPALFPASGSPNPMLNAVALARRLGDHLAAHAPFVPDPGFTALFDGVSTTGWKMSTINNQPNSDPGRFLVVDGALEAAPGNDLGLFWCTTPLPADFVLRLRFRRFTDDDNSGVFVRFPHPDGMGYQNTAWVGVHFGFEVQIHESDPEPIHRTGAFYDVADQTLSQVPPRPPGEWNQLEVSAVGQRYTALLNGVQVATFTNADPVRGQALPSFFGLQTHTGRVQFRDLQVRGG